MKRPFVPLLLFAVLALVAASAAPAREAERPPTELWDEFPLEATATPSGPAATTTPQPTPRVVREPGSEGGLSPPALAALLVAAAGLGALAARTATRRLRPRATPPSPTVATAGEPVARAKSAPTPEARDVSPRQPERAAPGNGRSKGRAAGTEERERQGGRSDPAPRTETRERQGGRFQPATGQPGRDSGGSAQEAGQSKRRVAWPDALTGRRNRPAADPDPEASKAKRRTAKPDPEAGKAKRRAADPDPEAGKAKRPAADPEAGKAKRRAPKPGQPPTSRPGDAQPPTGTPPERFQPATPEPMAAPAPPASPQPAPAPAATPRPAPAPVGPPEPFVAPASPAFDACRIRLHNRSIKAHFFAVPYDGGPVLARSPYFKIGRTGDDAGLSAPEALRALVGELTAAGWRQTSAGRAPWDLRFERTTSAQEPAASRRAR